MKPHLQCGEQQVSRSNLTKYCACHAGRLVYLVLITYETSFTMRGATGITIQPHQILRLPRKMTLQDFKENLRKQVKRHFQCGADPSMIRAWSDHENANRNPPRNRGYFSTSPRAFSIVKYNVSRPILHSNIHHATKSDAWTSPSTAPATKSDAWTSPSTAPATKSDTWTSPSTAPATKSDTWTSPSTAPATKSDTRTSLLYSTWLYSTLLDSAWLYTYESSFTMRGATGVTIQPHQILRLPRRKTHLLNHHHLSNLIYNAGSNRCHHPTSPNTAPATQNDSHAWSSSHMKPHFQCAEQQVSRSNLTKYCACHEKWHCKISKKISKNRWNVISNAGPIRAWSEHDPTMKTQTATRLATEVTFRPHHEHFLL